DKEMSKRITFIIGSLRGGGAEKVCVTLANGLSEKGYQIDLVVLNLVDAVRKSELSSKVNLINLGVGHTRYALPYIWKYVKCKRPSIILSFNRQISVLLALIKYFIPFKLVSRNIIFLSVAEAGKKGVWHGFISKLLVRKMYPRSDIIIAQSEAMKVDLVEYLGIPSNRVVVINNPINQSIEKFCDENTLAEQGVGQPYLLCVGRLDKQKGFEYAIQAFSGVAHDHPELRLKIVGKGPEEQNLRKLAQDFNLADRIDFESYQSDLIPYYLGAKETLLTSLFEGFPNVLIESIALGTPIIAFDCPSGPSEIVIDGVNGYLVKYLDFGMMVSSISKALTKAWS